MHNSFVVFKIGKHEVQSVINDARQLGVLDERHLVNILLVTASHYQVFVQIF